MLDLEDTMFRTYDKKTNKRKEDPEKTERTRKRALKWLEYVENKT